MVMKKEVTLGNLLGIMVPIFVLLIGWGVSINTRMSVHDSDIENNASQIEKNENKIEHVNDKIDKNFKIIQEKLDKILFHELKSNENN